MKMKLLFIILGIFLTKISVGQHLDKVTEYCKQKDYNKLTEYLDSLQNSDSEKVIKFRVYKEIHREIVNEYFETIFYYEEFMQSNISPNAYSSIPYCINIISNTNNIIYCSLVRQPTEENHDTLVNYFDNAWFSKLKMEYENVFKYSLDISELFDNSIVYGHNCGIVGTQPDSREKIEEYIKESNIEEINKWLNSPNVELQVYACEALYRLKENQISLDKLQLDMIMKIINKKGKIRTCSGCIYKDDKITYVCKDFKF